MNSTLLIVLGVIALLVVVAIAQYNRLIRLNVSVDESFAQIEVQLKRRSDLIPNLVNTVKGFAAQEQQVLSAVVEARSRVGSIQATPELVNDPEAFKRFQEAQSAMSSALSRLLVVVENYPQLKSDANFMRLQDEIAGTENRIAVERRKYNEAVQKYNTSIDLFPNNIAASIFGFQRNDAYFKTDPASRQAPKVDFNKK